MPLECPVCGGQYYLLFSIYSGEPICSDCGEWTLLVAEATRDKDVASVIRLLAGMNATNWIRKRDDSLDILLASRRRGGVR